MCYIAEREKYYLFVDECGDPFLNNVNKDFPVFTLCGIIVSESQLDALEQMLGSLKKHFWGERQIILHSRDIRKHQRGFEILLNPEVKKDFYERLNAIVGKEGAFTIVSCSILKHPFIEENGREEDVYGIALSRLIERSIFFLDELADKKATDLSIIYGDEREERRWEPNLLL